MNKNERLLLALGEVDEGYIKEAESKMSTKTIIKVAAIFAVVIALSLYLFIPFAPVTSDLSAYEGSTYFPLIEGIENYRLAFMQPAYKNNFEAMSSSVVDMFGGFLKGGVGGDMAPGMNGGSSPDFMENEATGNGSYIESTDNQVSGVIESDLFKMTDKYIFRIGYKDVENSKNFLTVLRVYSIAKEDSALVAEFEVPYFADERYNGFDYQMLEMYLSLDCRTVVLTKRFDSSGGDRHIGIISLDVSDVNSISTKGMVSIDGDLKTSRMVDGRLLLVTNYSFSRWNLDYSDPETFVPTIDKGNGSEPIEFENIIYPENVNGTGYSVVALLDAENLALLGANALLNFTSEVYVSENHVYITREYTEKTENQDGSITTSNMSDIAVFDYSGEGLTTKGIITARGFAEDQYSFDEKDGYLRVVTSTRDTTEMVSGDNVSMMPRVQNVSLYIFNLSDNSLAYSLESFAIEGEEATAVRFDGDMLYVCTAVVVTFTDPVYFIDLSDYDSITSADTGIIEGFSDHLINYGEGFLLGIGRLDWQYNKVDVYEKIEESVVVTMSYKFQGEYSEDYKSYLVNREENIFGFGVNGFCGYDEQIDAYKYYNCYVLIRFDQSEMYVDVYKIDDLYSRTVRAAYIDGYLYITTPTELIVQAVK